MRSKHLLPLAAVAALLLIPTTGSAATPQPPEFVYIGTDEPPPVPGHWRDCRTETVKSGPYAGYKYGICVWRPYTKRMASKNTWWASARIAVTGRL